MKMKELAAQMAELAEKMQKFPLSSDDSWDTAVEEAAKMANEVYKDSCNHTQQGIDYMKSLLQYTCRPTLWVEAEFQADLLQLVKELQGYATATNSPIVQLMHNSAEKLLKKVTVKPETQEKDPT